MKTLFAIALMLALVLDARGVQTNLLTFDTRDYSQVAQPNIRITLSLLGPNPRTYGGVFIRQQPVSKFTDTAGIGYFTNVLWGTYRADIAGQPGTSFLLYVGTNTLGTVNAASLVTNSAAVPPNDATLYYSKAQIDALLAALPGGDSGSATNVFFIAGQSTTPRTIGGSNAVDVTGTLTNSTTGNAATATSATNLFSHGVFNVRNYGALGLGASSTGVDSFAISNAIVAWTNMGGGVLYFPAGEYHDTNNHHFSAETYLGEYPGWPASTIRGDGFTASTWKYTGPMTTGAFLQFNNFNAAIRDIGFEGPGKTVQGLTGLSITNGGFPALYENFLFRDWGTGLNPEGIAGGRIVSGNFTGNYVGLALSTYVDGWDVTFRANRNNFAIEQHHYDVTYPSGASAGNSARIYGMGIENGVVLLAASPVEFGGYFEGTTNCVVSIGHDTNYWVGGEDRWSRETNGISAVVIKSLYGLASTPGDGDYLVKVFRPTTLTIKDGIFQGAGAQSAVKFYYGSESNSVAKFDQVENLSTGKSVEFTDGSYASDSRFEWRVKHNINTFRTGTQIGTINAVRPVGSVYNWDMLLGANRYAQANKTHRIGTWSYPQGEGSGDPVTAFYMVNAGNGATEYGAELFIGGGTSLGKPTASVYIHTGDTAAGGSSGTRRFKVDSAGNVDWDNTATFDIAHSSTNTLRVTSGGSTINAVGITNGNVTIPGTLGVTGATTAGVVTVGSIGGSAAGLSNFSANAVSAAFTNANVIINGDLTLGSVAAGQKFLYLHDGTDAGRISYGAGSFDFDYGIQAAQFSGGGINLTTLNASALSSGTVADARISNTFWKTNEINRVFVVTNSAIVGPEFSVNTPSYRALTNGARFNIETNGTYRASGAITAASFADPAGNFNISASSAIFATEVYSTGRFRIGNYGYLIGGTNGPGFYSGNTVANYTSIGTSGLATYSTNVTVAAANTAGYTNSGVAGQVNRILNLYGTSGTFVFYNRSGANGQTVCGRALYTNTVTVSGVDIPVGVNCGIEIVSGVDTVISVRDQ